MALNDVLTDRPSDQSINLTSIRLFDSLPSEAFSSCVLSTVVLSSLSWICPLSRQRGLLTIGESAFYVVARCLHGWGLA